MAKAQAPMLNSLLLYGGLFLSIYFMFTWNVRTWISSNANLLLFFIMGVITGLAFTGFFSGGK